MKRIIYLFSFLAFIGSSLISCDFEDKGSPILEPMTDIIIDTTGIPLSLEATRLEDLVVNPNVSREGVSDDVFKYEWRMTLLPGSDFTKYKVVGTEKSLSYNIDLIPDANYYSLWYRVTDTTTGLMSSIVWRVVVSASSGQGLVVADSQDGVNSDLSVIQDTLFTTNWVQKGTTTKLPTTYKRNIFSQTNGKKFTGVIHSMFTQRLYRERRYTNYIHGASVNNCFRINTLDYSMVLEGREMFYDPDIVLNINHYFLNGPQSTSGSAWIVNSGKISNRVNEASTFMYYRKFSVEVPGDYIANKHIAVHPTLVSEGVFYDEVHGKFYKIGTSLNTKVAAAEVGSGSSPFNGRDLPGYTVLGGGVASPEVRFVLKKDSYYGVFTFTQNSATTPRRMLDISNAPDIANAVNFVFPLDEAVIYYATPSKVYSIRIPDGGAVTYTELYTSPEPITKLEMLRMTGYVNVPYHERCLLAITYNGSEGKITALPIPASGLGLGIVDLNRKATFGGFKRISSVAVTD
ncbi:MAG: PKD-like family lipoprotein [Bacteroidales bacterium]|nr:PKD-like family lipoprotein [Bacteroidales bacterium]MDD2425956.1 PKD-like family lipoprotein [Bacteroidales bacterium]MDD3990179.1 PKD-like family lipoprotein [Bacteroidales bacterium]